MSSINPFVQLTQQFMLGGAVKQNHALEHATIVLLSKKYPDVRLAGISFAAGFFVFGDLPTEAIYPTAQEALNLLRTTSPELAIHERCGTNLAVTGLLTGLSAMTVARMRRPYGSFNNVVLATTAALIVSRPAGLKRAASRHHPDAQCLYDHSGSKTHEPFRDACPLRQHR